MNTPEHARQSTGGTFVARLRRTTVIFIGATFIWAAVYVLVDKALLYGWLGSDAMVLAAIGVSAVLGLGVIFAYVRHLASMDELQQRIQFSAMAFSLGATLVGAMTYMLLTAAGLIQNPDVRDMVLLLTLSYISAVIYGQVRYR